MSVALAFALVSFTVSFTVGVTLGVIGTLFAFGLFILPAAYREEPDPASMARNGEEVEL